MPFPPYPTIPAPFTWTKGEPLWAEQLRSDVWNSLLLATQPPMFCGAQTGVPLPFTSLAAVSISAPGTAYAADTPVVFSGSLPTGLTAGTIYYVINPTGATFGISTTQGGSAYTGYSSGSGTVQMTELLSTGVWTGVNLDTELSDVWAGHQVSSNAPYYYGMLPGYYLAECYIPASYTGSSGSVSAGLFTQEGGNPAATIGGGTASFAVTAASNMAVSVAKIVQMSVTGTYGGLVNNYVGAAAWQDTGGNITTLATASRNAVLNVEWLASLTGNPDLPLPDNDVWPAPPLTIGRTFVNKNLRDTIGFLAYKPVMEAVNTATQSLASAASLPATGTTVQLNAVNADTQSAFNTGTHVWTCPVAGIYDLYGQVPVIGATTAVAVAAGFTVKSANYNGGTQFTIWGPVTSACPNAAEVSCATARRRVRLNFGDTVSLAGFQNDSGANAHLIQNSTWTARLITIWRGK